MVERLKQAPADKVRVDKWLWAARFYKTRSLAATAVSGGKVHVNDSRVKPGRVLAPGDELTISRDGITMAVIVRALSGRRGPAMVAQQLYEETEQSRQQREQLAEQRRILWQPAPNPGTRPNKKARRDMARFSGR